MDTFMIRSHFHSVLAFALKNKNSFVLSSYWRKCKPEILMIGQEIFAHGYGL